MCNPWKASPKQKFAFVAKFPQKFKFCPKVLLYGRLYHEAWNSIFTLRGKVFRKVYLFGGRSFQGTPPKVKLFERLCKDLILVRYLNCDDSRIFENFEILEDIWRCTFRKAMCTFDFKNFDSLREFDFWYFRVSCKRLPRQMCKQNVKILEVNQKKGLSAHFAHLIEQYNTILGMCTFESLFGPGNRHCRVPEANFDTSWQSFLKSLTFALSLKLCCNVAPLIGVFTAKI